MVVVRFIQMVALVSLNTVYYGELQGLQALVVGDRWSLDISGRQGRFHCIWVLASTCKLKSYPQKLRLKL